MNAKKNIDINSRIKDLQNDFINGSSVIAQNSLKIFIDAVDLFNNSEHFNTKIKDIAKKIIQAKPAMASINNIINLALLETLSTINNNSQEIYDKVCKKIEIAKKTTLDTAINEITSTKFENIITCSYSSTVIKLFSELKNRVYEFKVLILESIWKGIDFSKNLQMECKNMGINSEIVQKEKILTYDFAIIGADSIIKSQGVINGIPSKYLAVNSKKKNIAFYVIGESYKNSEHINIEDGFELIENKYITKIFTDGVFS